MYKRGTSKDPAKQEKIEHEANVGGKEKNIIEKRKEKTWIY